MNKVVDMSVLEPAIREIIDAGGTVRLKVTGRSMLPTLAPDRDFVLLVKPTKLKRTDIVLYQRPGGEYVLHRIIKSGKSGFYICGDNQLDVEYPVPPENIIAVVCAIVRKGKLIEKSNFSYKLSAKIWSSFISLRPFMFKIAMKFKNRRR